MKEENFQRNIRTLINLLLVLIVVLLIVMGVLFHSKLPKDKNAMETIQNEFPEEVLVVDLGYEVVKSNCTACHSARLVTQNRATREGWKSMIRWMQKTQNLWGLGDNEDIILDYLAKNYAPENKGRRQPLVGVEWYELD